VRLRAVVLFALARPLTCAFSACGRLSLLRSFGRFRSDGGGV